VAHAQELQCHGSNDNPGIGMGGEQTPEFGDGSQAEDVADTHDTRLAIWQGIPGDNGTELQAVERGGWWATEPDVGRIFNGVSSELDEDLTRANAWTDGREDGIPRIATGIPASVDRLRCLGNAVVPQVAEYLGRLVLTKVAG